MPASTVSGSSWLRIALDKLFANLLVADVAKLAQPVRTNNVSRAGSNRIGHMDEINGEVLQRRFILLGFVYKLNH